MLFGTLLLFKCMKSIVVTSPRQIFMEIFSWLWQWVYSRSPDRFCVQRIGLWFSGACSMETTSSVMRNRKGQWSMIWRGVWISKSDRYMVRMKTVLIPVEYVLFKTFDFPIQIALLCRQYKHRAHLYTNYGSSYNFCNFKSKRLTC